MKKDMYFLPILANAIKAPDRKYRLYKAIKKIKSLNQEPEYATGYLQFLHFMQKAKDNWDAGSIKLLIRKEGQTIESIALNRPNFIYRISDITPGTYTVELSTGRVLWDAKLTDKDLLWTAAYPLADIQLAAKTGDQGYQPTSEVTLLKGKLILKVFPSMGKGWIEIEAMSLQ